MFINVFAFNVFLQLMHSYGPVVATAVTITFNYDLVAFIPMLGVGHAVTAIVGQRMGAGDPEGARRAAYLGMKVAWSYAGIMMLVFVLLAPRLAAFFLHGAAGSAQTILALAIPMLRLAALYTLADATNVVFSGALRGAGDTTWVMIVSGLLHWAMAVVSFLFIRVLVLPPLIVWLLFIVFVVAIGATMFLRHRGGAWRAIRLVESAAQPSLAPRDVAAGE
jgi:MATE family multidrug resistance protein